MKLYPRTILPGACLVTILAITLPLSGCVGPAESTLPITGNGDVAAEEVSTLAPAMPKVEELQPSSLGYNNENSIWIGTDGNGLCTGDGSVTDAGEFEHPSLGVITLAVCGQAYGDWPDYQTRGGDDQAIGLIDGKGEVVWKAPLTYSMMFFGLPEQFQDATGNIFIYYFTGGAHCCGGLVVLRPDNNGMKFIVGESNFTDGPSNFPCIESDGDGSLLVPNDSGEFYIRTQWNDYKPSYATGTETQYLFAWNPETLEYEPFSGSAAEKCQIVSDYFEWPELYQECIDGEGVS